MHTSFNQQSDNSKSVLLLTPRQAQIFERVINGMKYKDIADELGLGVRTIDTHLGIVFKKVGVNSKNKLLNWCVQKGNEVIIKCRKQD